MILSGIRGVRRNRTLFLSDIHLATRGCRADMLLEFLRRNDADTIYLVGDIVDFWSVKRCPVWPQSHSDVLRVLLQKVSCGTRLLFIPGNHDEGLRDYCGTRLGGIKVVRDCMHTTADGRRLLVVHGDEFEFIVRFAKWLRFLSDRGRLLARLLNGPLHLIRRHFGIGLWSLSAHLRRRVKTAANLIGNFEQALAEEARRRCLDGVVCGHIHYAAHRDIDGIEYLNCGDWIDSCTAIAEDAEGGLKIINWLVQEPQTSSVSEPNARRAA